MAVNEEAGTHGDPAGQNLLQLPPDRLLHCRSDRAGGRGGAGGVELVDETLPDASDERVRIEGSIQRVRASLNNVP